MFENIVLWDLQNRMNKADCICELKWIRGVYAGMRKEYGSCVEALDMAINALEQTAWIPCSERLPEEAYPVIVTWKNDDPASYYQYVLGKHYVGVAHYKNGKWFWYSSVTEDTLMEYGRCDSEEFDEAIEVLAWMPMPKPYGGEQDGSD